MANCKLNPHPTANACTTLHKTAKQITVVSAHKPIDMSCRKMKTHAKLVTADKTTHAEFHKSKFRPVRNRPKLWNSKTSQNCYSTPISAWQLFRRSFCISPRSCRRLPSLAIPPGLEPLQKPIHWEETCPLRRSCERPRQTCTTSCHSRRNPKPS